MSEEKKSSTDTGSEAPIAIGGRNSVTTSRWRLFKAGEERYLVLQYPAATEGRLQRCGPIETIDPMLPKLYTRLGACFELNGPPETSPAFLAKAMALVRGNLHDELEDESDAVYFRWCSNAQ